MSFSDIFKKDFLASFTSGSADLSHITLVLLITCLIAGYIFVFYRLITRKTFYSKNFNISVAAIAVITAAIILAVQSSIVISLGMVGALSIVRFRTAIKEPMDLCFLFWAISVGICCGAYMTEIALVLSAVLTVLIIILDRLPIGKAPMLLIVNLQSSKAEPELLREIERFCRHYRIKSRNSSPQGCNLIAEVRIRQEYELLQAVEALAAVETVSLVAYDGEVTF